MLYRLSYTTDNNDERNRQPGVHTIFFLLCTKLYLHDLILLILCNSKMVKNAKMGYLGAPECIMRLNDVIRASEVS